MNKKNSLNRIVALLKEKNCFLIMTHKNPDIDGIASMLAIGKALLDSKKDVTLLTIEPLSAPLVFLKGAERIKQQCDLKKDFDAYFILDCAEIERLGSCIEYVRGRKPIVNIDHHETNDFFGDLNLVEAKSSSTGELIYRVIKEAGFAMNFDVAENIFAAIQADTGSFKYNNTTSACFNTARELMEYGVKPWEVSLKMMNEYSLPGLKLLGMALGTLKLHHEGKICIMTISSEMFNRTGASWMDSESFVDYPRFVSDVEIAVLIRQSGKNDYKVSLRSKNRINVAQLASQYGGGGHAGAAGFDCHGGIDDLQKDFLKEAGRLLDEAPC